MAGPEAQLPRGFHGPGGAGGAGGAGGTRGAGWETQHEVPMMSVRSLGTDMARQMALQGNMEAL